MNIPDDQLTIFHPDETITVPSGCYAYVSFKKIEVTKDEVLRKLIDLDPHTCRAGDVSEIRLLARVALDDKEDNTEL